MTTMNPADTTDTSADAERGEGIPRIIERKTALWGENICRPTGPERVDRQRTRRAIDDKDPKVPYPDHGTAFRDLICSLVERQDRMSETIFKKSVDPGYRANDRELRARPGV